jgi:hypothetical protein
MRLRRLIVSAAAAATVALASAAQVAEAPIASIETEYLGRLKVATDPAEIIVPSIVYPVTSCSFRGPKIKATCVAWVVATPDGPSRLEIRANLKTDEGDVISMEEGIILQRYNAVVDRSKKGGTLASKDENVANSPRFTTTSRTYSWLNGVQTLAKRVVSDPGQIEYDLFVVR